MNYTKPTMLDALVRRFVLGTLSRRARRRFSRLVDEDPHIAQCVHALEADLLPLAWSLPPEQPSELVWKRIARTAGFGEPRSSASKPTANTRWPLTAAAMFAAVLISAYGWWQERQKSPEQVINTITEYLPVEPAIGVITDDDGNSLWVARIYPDLRRADVVVATAPDAQSANDYELWILREDGVPVSIGVLPQSGETQLTLTANAIDGLGRGETLAVSLEPLGGSPADVPTGPVLYTTAMLSP